MSTQKQPNSRCSAERRRKRRARNARDELIYVLDGSVVLDIVEGDGPPKSFTIGAGMMVIVPPGAWHRFHSTDGATTMSAVIPGENIDLDVDDPRQIELKPA